MTTKQDLWSRVDREATRVTQHSSMPIGRILLSPDLYEIVRGDVERGVDPFGLGVPIVITHADMKVKPNTVLFGVALVPDNPDETGKMTPEEVRAAIPRMEGLADKLGRHTPEGQNALQIAEMLRQAQRETGGE